MDNPEETEMTIENRQSRENWKYKAYKTNKNTTQYVLDTTIYKQTQIT